MKLDRDNGTKDSFFVYFQKNSSLRCQRQSETETKKLQKAKAY